MNPCQVCGVTIDAARSEAAQSRRKTPTYCSARCYRAGIKRTYRAKRKSVASITSHNRPQGIRDQVLPELGEAITLDNIRALALMIAQQDREGIRSLAARIRKALDQRGI